MKTGQQFNALNGILPDGAAQFPDAPERRILLPEFLRRQKFLRAFREFARQIRLTQADVGRRSNPGINPLKRAFLRKTVINGIDRFLQRSRKQEMIRIVLMHCNRLPFRVNRNAIFERDRKTDFHKVEKAAFTDDVVVHRQTVLRIRFAPLLRKERRCKQKEEQNPHQRTSPIRYILNARSSLMSGAGIFTFPALE